MIDIVIGGQYGSEGKGKVAYYLANLSNHKCVARIGGPNSGHTAQECVLKHLPVSVLIPNSISIIGAGSYIDVNILREEIFKYRPDNLLIDSKAVVIRHPEVIALNYDIGSTLSGTGTGVYDRVKRSNTIFISAYEEFKPYIVDTSVIHKAIKDGCIIEGTQGFGLSNIHTCTYPYCTSRDTTASGFAAELGISPRWVRNIYMVIRTYPIRVAGNSGPLPLETHWDVLNIPKEYTSVTKKIRRVGYFDAGIVRCAIRYNDPTHIVLNHLDYISENLRSKFIHDIELSIRRPISHVGLGPDIIEELGGIS